MSQAGVRIDFGARRAWAVVLAGFAAAGLCVLVVRAASGESLEPPPEAGEGDYALEYADSLEGGAVETTLDATGTRGTAPRRAQRLRFRGNGTDGSLRDGDALAGGRIDAPLGDGRLRVGRLAPRWGRGLVLGAPAEPWSLESLDRGERARFAGRAGDGAAYASGGGGAEMLAGRFAKRSLAGARLARGPLALAALGGRGSGAASGAFGDDSAGLEFGLDTRGRWRAEGALEAVRDRATVVLRARGGLAGFRALAEPARAGPAQVLAASARAEESSRVWRGLVAWWRFAPGADGARASLEVRQRVVHHAQLVLGLEQRQGVRREPTAVASVSATALRQGFTCEWHAQAGDRDVALHHEWWGAHAFARDGRGRVFIARVSAALPCGAAIVASQSAWDVAPGESRWLADPGPDRLTLRALSGRGGRSRLELAIPCLGGRARLGAAWTDGTRTRAAPSWSAEWTRRTRL